MNVKNIVMENKAMKEQIATLEHQLSREKRFKDAVKLNNSKLTLERNALIEENTSLRQELNKIKELSMYEFADKYCTSEELEEAGHQLARRLGVGV